MELVIMVVVGMFIFSVLIPTFKENENKEAFLATCF